MTQPWLDGVNGTEVIPLIESTDPVIRVEAGPGAGKTFGLVRRVHRLVHSDGENVSGREILIAAFNRVIAKSLRADVETELHRVGIEEVPVIETLHALCLRIIGRELRIVMDHERNAMIFDIRQQHQQLRQVHLRPENTDQALRDHEAGHTPDPFLWSAVQQWLRRHHANLISELPTLLLARLDAGDFQTTRYAHVFVDEFQDLTEAEQRLIVTLMRENGNLVALGDPRQSIYKFRGNDREGLSKLEVLQGQSVTDVPMVECQRCPAPLVAAANQLMVSYPSAPMISTSSRSANLRLVTWNTPLREAKGMARVIVDNYLAHPEDRHLVMVTRRKFAFMLRKEMNALDSTITVDLNFSESLLERWAVREAFIFFCLLVDPDAVSWRAWFSYQNSITGERFKASNRNAAAYLQFLTDSSDAISWESVSALASEDRSANRGSGGRILWDRATRALVFRSEVPEIFDDPEGWLAALFDEARWASMTTIDRDEAVIDMGLAREKALAILQSERERSPEAEGMALLKGVARTLRYQIATREPFESEIDANVTVSTLWGAKGVTAEHVYILGLFKEALPGHRRSEYPGTDDEYFEEQRRLFYVSITRAKETMFLSRPRKFNRSEAAKLGIELAPGRSPWPVVEASPFLLEIIGHLPSAEDGENWSRATAR